MRLLGQIVCVFVILVVITKLPFPGAGPLQAPASNDWACLISRGRLVFEASLSGNLPSTFIAGGGNGAGFRLISLALCNLSLLASCLLQDRSQVI